MPRKRIEASKRCLGCEQELPLSAFKLTNGLYARRCRACYAKAHRDRYHTDEAYRQRQIQYSMGWQRRNKDSFNAIVKRYTERKRTKSDPPSPEASRRCLGCEQELPLSAFKLTKGLYTHRCRACYAKAQRDRYRTDEAYRQRKIQSSAKWQRTASEKKKREAPTHPDTAPP